MSESLVVTLNAQRGNKFDETGETIGSHERSIVFLPKGTEPGKRYRVQIEAIPRSVDRNGLPLYRSQPASAERVERWRDNGDGTISRVMIAIDWKLVEHEVAVIETRPTQKREGTPSSRTKRTPVLRLSRADSYVEKVVVTVIPLEQEAVRNGALVWEMTGEREEPAVPSRIEVDRIEVVGGDWIQHQFDAVYDPNWSLQVRFHFPMEDWVSSADLSTTWGAVPVWFQSELTARYPVCVCGRQRRDAQVSDAYGQCELCRAEETCVRCGKKRAPGIVNLTGRLVCTTCQPYETWEQKIETLLPKDRREVLAAEATKLLAGRALGRNEGEMVLQVTADHLDPSAQSRIVAKWSGYGWYYFCDDGVFGTKLAPEALTILQYLPQATGNGLVEMVAWLSGSLKPDSSDYYTRTQVLGEKVALPQLEETIRKLAEGSVSLAVRIRGSEQARQDVVSKFQAIEGRLHWSDPELDQIKAALHGDTQDYDEALRLITKAETVVGLREKVKQAVEQYFGHCPICGSALRDGVCDDGSAHFERVRYQGDDTIRLGLIRTDDGKIVAEAVTGGYALNRYAVRAVVVRWWSHEGVENRWDGRTPFQKLEYVDFGRVQAQETPVVRDGRLRVEALERELARVEAELDRAAAAYSVAEEAWLERETASPGSQPIDYLTVFEVPGFVESQDPQGQTRLQYGPFWDYPSGTQVVLVLDPFSRSSEGVTPGQKVLVRVRPRSGIQLHLFRGRVADNTGRKILATGFFVQVVEPLQWVSRRIEEVKRELQKAQDELEELKQRKAVRTKPAASRPSVGPLAEDQKSQDDALPDTAMQEAMRRAGLVGMKPCEGAVWYDQYEAAFAQEDGSEEDFIVLLPNQPEWLDGEGERGAYVFGDSSVVVVDHGTMGDSFDVLMWYRSLAEALAEAPNN